ncbi:MBL fold metallo-hydrolase [Marivibrio halodurans]|uniref:MBL fold metallo-hydrolase n=1 Tax=Marivibrio halodurans TaxID=2039722 RepID=A0A8J7RWJ4_9PROT|nr:MBL fold metallo-hydrolase [Marivibrio halodurans]MBP5856022.1 MBL fold metallo-hydrolase [Marivibrio halodurans]
MADAPQDRAESLSPLQGMIVPVTPFQQNCSVLWCTTTGKAAVIDPGGDLERIEEALAQARDGQGVILEKILLTHGHLDHAGGAMALKEAHGVPIEGPEEEEVFWLSAMEDQVRKFGMAGADPRPVVPDRWLKDGDTVTIGDVTLDVYHCPGHTPGHVIFHSPDAKLAIVGDVLFQGSIGRTDFPRGNHEQLIEAITTKLWPLGDDTAFIPGHGPMSTFGQERQSNPFVGDRALKGA